MKWLSHVLGGLAAAMAIIAATALPTRAELLFGVKAGPSFASQSTDAELLPGVEWSTRRGFAVGADVEMSMAPWLRIRAEPMLVEKGKEVDWPDDMAGFDGVWKYKYLSIPVNLKALVKIGNVRPFVFAGASVGFVLSSEVEAKNGGTSFGFVSHDVDLGLDLGGGVEIALGRLIGIMVDGRYSLGLVDVEDDLDVDKEFDSSVKNRAVLILAGVVVTL